MERVWKEFGKHTPAGKLLYDLYGVSFKPEDHIVYPKLKIDKQKNKGELLTNQQQSKTHRAKTSEKISKINYPSLNSKQLPKIAKVDLIKKRKTEFQIKNELIKRKEETKPPVMNPFANKNRKEQIEKLQSKFQYEEKKYLPEKARPPRIVFDEEEMNKEVMNNLNNRNTKGHYNNNNSDGYGKYSKDELTNLYNDILCEIDERYKMIEDIKKQGGGYSNVNVNNNKIGYNKLNSNCNNNNINGKKQDDLMNEIKDKIKDLRIIEKLRKDQLDNMK